MRGKIPAYFHAAVGTVPLTDGWEWRQQEGQAILVLPVSQLEKMDTSEAWHQALRPGMWAALRVSEITVTVDYTVAGQVRQSTLDVEITDRSSSAWVAALVALAICLFAALLLRRRAAPSTASSGPLAGVRSGLVGSFLDLIVTPLGTYSLSMAQVLTWTALTLFGYIFLWLMTDGTPQVPAQILELLGVGTGTALLSRLANGDKQSLPGRSLRLVLPQGKPSPSDLITIEGRASLFKFQMLGFTVVTAVILLHELYVGCRFAAISDSLVTLMGLSSTAYLGNETLQGQPWGRVRRQIAQVEELAKTLNILRETETAQGLLLLMQDAAGADVDPRQLLSDPSPANLESLRNLHHELVVLRSMLTEICTELPLSELPPPAVPPASGAPPAGK